MLIKLETYKIETGDKIATDFIVTDSPRRAMDMINEADDVKYHILTEEEERTFWAAQMGKIKSKRKAAAVRENGRKGGRPRKVTS